MFGLFQKKKPTESANQPEQRRGFFSTDVFIPGKTFNVAPYLSRTFQVDPATVKAYDRSGSALAMDSAGQSLKNTFNNAYYGVPFAQFAWYGSQGFIGYQMCAMIAQNWLVDKACTMPARDAIRVGYDISVTDGTEVKTEVLEEIKKIDKLMKLDKNCEQFVRMGRIFGIRIAMFKVESTDPEYYLKPFNPDGIRPGSYKGIAQIDPYWITPELDASAAADPSAIDFYEPTWWRVNGQRIHKSHLVIMRTNEVADILKPSYLYGGISIPQKIYERVYAAERTANEAPLLAMTKRTNTLHVDIEQAFANQGAFEQRMQQWTEYRDNFGVKVLGLNETMEQFDTSLAELDAVIMTQFQLVAAAANVPATKLLGTTPKGFNATGEYEESSYHEELESIQVHDLQPLIERHHLLVIRSEIVPKFKIKAFETSVTWGTLDALTAEEQANVNLVKAQTGQVLVMSGALDGQDERARIIADPDSGYNGIPDADPNDPYANFEPEPDDESLADGEETE